MEPKPINMKHTLLIICAFCSLFASAQPTLADTTKIAVFDRTNEWVTTGALLKAYCAAGGGGGGDLVNGGQSTGATVSYGTTDAQAAAIKTNSVERLSITGGASTGGAMTLTNVTANTNSVQDVLIARANSSGTAAANFGVGLLFQGESSTTDNQDLVRLSAIETTATHASRASALVYSDVTAGGALTERFRFTPTAMTTATGYTIGNSAQALTLGGSSGPVYMSSSDNSAGVITFTASGAGASILFDANSNGGTSTSNVVIGNTAPGGYTQTSGTRSQLSLPRGFAPTSGTAVHNKISITGTLNQTGGANGIVRGINLAHTVTAVADYRAIEIADNGSNVKGVYQTGSTAVNNFVGKTGFGSTTAPVGLISVAAGTTTVAPIVLTSGTNTTSVRDGAVEFDGTNYFVSSGGVRYTMAKVLTGSATLDFGATAAGAKTDLTVTVTGAAVGDVANVGVDLTTVSVTNGTWTAYVSATDTVTVRFANNDLTTAQNPASATYKVTVTKF
jgi:hypothetical protein